MSYCTKCGEIVEENEKFCSSCGCENKKYVEPEKSKSALSYCQKCGCLVRNSDEKCLSCGEKNENYIYEENEKNNEKEILNTKINPFDFCKNCGCIVNKSEEKCSSCGEKNENFYISNKKETLKKQATINRKRRIIYWFSIITFVFGILSIVEVLGELGLSTLFFFIPGIFNFVDYVRLSKRFPVLPLVFFAVGINLGALGTSLCLI